MLRLNEHCGWILYIDGMNYVVIFKGIFYLEKLSDDYHFYDAKVSWLFISTYNTIVMYYILYCFSSGFLIIYTIVLPTE